ncbi:ATP-binding cassette domain-containing protein [Rhizobium mesosinicum]|uniref:ATP-binding cassette domain-containing protein n=1 Tax=Rhizobium mesosinicum TaxID=335017 RepID=A0ABS7H2E8_9HYPH|nr:ATP-binding cassette domain-containing protein [Rhizobium mesosinicum]
MACSWRTMDIPFPSLLIKGFPQESRCLRARREEGEGYRNAAAFRHPSAIGLERVGEGPVRWSGEDIAALSEGRRDRFRAANIGLVMQEFHLLSWAFGGRKRAVARAATSAVIERAHNLLEIAGVGRAWQKVETMSRDKMQRVAIAPALLRRRGVMVADEPTASLDAESGDAVGDLLLDLAATEGTSTHSFRLLLAKQRRQVAHRLRIRRRNACDHISRPRCPAGGARLPAVSGPGFAGMMIAACRACSAMAGAMLRQFARKIRLKS